MINTNINKTVLAALASLCAWSTWATVPDSWEGDVVLPANTTTETITLSSDVKPTTLTVKGSYVIAGTGVINPGATAGNVTIESGASLTINNGTYVPTAGYVVNGELILKKNYSIGQNFATFTGSGTLVLDGVYYKNYNNNGYYGSSITSFEGTLILKNGSTVQTSGNTKTAAQLGKGKVVFSGGTATLGNNSYTSNSSYEIVAGTTNTDEMTLPLDKTTIVKGDTELVDGQQYLVMTAGGVSGTGPTVSSELTAAGWSARLCKNDTGKIEIYLLKSHSLVWNGSDGDDWTKEGVWLDGDEAATFKDLDNVTFPADKTGSVKISSALRASTITVNGTVTFGGTGTLKCYRAEVGDGVSLTADGAVFAGDLLLNGAAVYHFTSSSSNPVAVGNVTVSESDKAYYYVDSGYADFSGISLPWFRLTIAEEAISPC